MTLKSICFSYLINWLGTLITSEDLPLLSDFRPNNTLTLQCDFDIDLLQSPQKLNHHPRKLLRYAILCFRRIRVTAILKISKLKIVTACIQYFHSKMLTRRLNSAKNTKTSKTCFLAWHKLISSRLYVSSALIFKVFLEYIWYQCKSCYDIQEEAPIICHTYLGALHDA